MIRAAFSGEDVKTVMLPDIQDVYFSRNVGWGVVEIEDVPPEIKGISGTELRNKMAGNDPSWRDCVPEPVALILEEMKKDS